MALQDSYQCLSLKSIPTDTASTDGAYIDIPWTGKGIAVRRITIYDSRIGSTNATADNSTATLGVFTAVAAGGVAVVANAALTTHTTNLIVSDRTIAAVGITPLVTATRLYFRTGTASGVTGSVVSATVEYSALP